jgi:hypothetical protein
MGAMKAIYTDIQELRFQAAMGDEESFIEYVQAAGWISPTEREIAENRARSVDLTATGGISAIESHPNGSGNAAPHAA